MKDKQTASRAAKSALYEQFARIGHALASAKRIELVDLLAQAEQNVEALSQQAQLPLKSTSAHLRVLRAARLVDSRRDGKFVVYRLADPQVGVLARCLVDVARDRLAEVEQISRSFLQERDSLDAIGLVELRQRLRRADVVLLDVRPAAEFDAGHLRGARNVPLSALRAALAHFPRDHEIVAYCRGPFCVLAPDAVALLRRRGFRARRLEVGFPEARDAGFAVSARRPAAHAYASFPPQ
jgi:rhodanese-related sulfurtransferase